MATCPLTETLTAPSAATRSQESLVPGGTVTVSARREGEHAIRFSVRDSGHGIPAEAFARIFDKFGQVGVSKVGTGLGLAFCKLAVEAHGGSITVESTLTVGSTFSFTVPVDENARSGEAKLPN